MTLPFSPAYAADVLLIAYAVLHLAHPRSRLLPQPRGADRGATMILFGCCALTVVVVNIPSLPAMFLSSRTRWSGVGVQSAGLVLLLWSLATIKRCMSTSPETGAWAFDAGPYRHIRHPVYLGSLLIWSGAIAASGNGIALVSIMLAMLAAYATRIAHEEQLLKRAVGLPYEAYCQRSWRMIPFLY
jgi:protein-S-isoprenylcysteine O-methyltransferase Ste14